MKLTKLLHIWLAWCWFVYEAICSDIDGSNLAVSVLQMTLRRPVFRLANTRNYWVV